MHLVKPFQSSAAVDVERHLRPADAKIFRVLKKAAEERPGTYLPMSEIIDLAFGALERSPTQVKNIVQRSVYEIRQKFGRDAVLSRGALYRLHLEAVSTPLDAQVTMSNGEVGPWGQFGQRVLEILNAARGIRGATLSRLVFLGEDALGCLKDHPQELWRVLCEFRTIQIFCPDPRLVVQCLESLSSVEPMGMSLREYGAFIKMVVTPVPGIAGIAWIDQFDADSFIELGGGSSEPVRVVEGAGVHRFMAHYDRRLSMLEGERTSDALSIRADRFDVPTQRLLADLREFLLMKRTRKEDGRVVPFVDDLLR